MKIILPGLEDVTNVRFALQQYVNRVAMQIGGKTTVVREAPARALLEVLVVDALTMGMAPRAALAYEAGVAECYEAILEPLFDLLGVTVPFDVIYTELLDPLVVSQWSRLEPYLHDRVPYDVSVTWLGNNILVTSDARGSHFPPRKRHRRRPSMLNSDFEQANQIAAASVPEGPLPFTVSVEAYHRGEAQALLALYQEGRIPPQESLRNPPGSSSVPHYLIMKERDRPAGPGPLPPLAASRDHRDYVEGEFDQIIEELLPTQRRDS